MTSRTNRFGLQVDTALASFIEDRAIPGTGVEPDAFWKGFADMVDALSPINARLLKTRETTQAKIDAWHRDRKDLAFDAKEYRSFLEHIGYIVPEFGDFKIETTNVDPEIALIPGPQLVVPVMNARYALNAANARWGSLYDALYGTDAMGSVPIRKEYEPNRGAQVIDWARAFLDDVLPLAHGSWTGATGLVIEGDSLAVSSDSGRSALRDENAFTGYTGTADEPESIILTNNGLHVRIMLDATSEIAKQDSAGISDIVLESAMSTIMDCEDSVAAVDAEDKVIAYANWLGLMVGNLSESVNKGGRTIERVLNPDVAYTAADGSAASLKGRSLMLVRNVGHLMTNPAILDRDGDEVPEGLMDAMITVLIAMHDLNKTAGMRNSVKGSVYVVKPKMHGPEEVVFADRIFTVVEEALGLPKYTVKLGIMDEERRTSANLRECIRAAKHRVAFINTGFLDRTGDEIHTSMEAGAFLRKDEIKTQPWIKAYEDRNVDIGLACGLQGKAQIGKGMWAMPDLMNGMLDQKIAHPQSGANCAWVPSPTAATLHATHYHRVDVMARQNEIAAGGPRGKLEDLLTIPLARGRNWSQEEIQAEVENNAQGILGYVVRWIDHGVGCSKVPDINNVGLMEDRATCRISSQHLANWLHHGVVTEAEVLAAMKKMAAVVDEQNSGDPAYQKMGPHFDGVAFRAAVDLVIRGREQPSGYTEPVLHRRRQERKALA